MSPTPLPGSSLTLSSVLERMLNFAEDAGQHALACRDKGLNVAYKGEGLGEALTEADLAISNMLHQRFGPRLIEEETAESLSYAEAKQMLLEAAWTFIADPIDGTRPFAGGLTGWGVMVAACRNGWPVASVLHLPAWHDDRTRPARRESVGAQQGLLLAAWEGVAYWASTRGGRLDGTLEVLPPFTEVTSHVGWLPVAAQRYTLDYRLGFFPWCESGAIADAALLATGRLDATLSNHKLWDLAPILPVVQALGFNLYHWPDLASTPHELIDLFDQTFSCHDDLWLICRDRKQAERLAASIRRVGDHEC
jgi:fructose-1,6-bisphosphatase/inositol monophosphatase family enzyme